MANDMFKFSSRDLAALKRFYKKAPAKFKRVEANVLTSFAFGVRRESLDVIHKKLTIRDKRFASSSMRVEKARTGRLMAAAGSLNRARFTGWKEQQTGSPDKRGRVATLFGRTGNIKNKIRPLARMKSGKNFLTPKDFPGKSNEHRSIVMLQVIRRTKDRKPFIMTKRRGWKSGLYKLQGRKIKRLQDFSPRSTRIRRVPWMTIAKKQYFAKNPPRQTWAKSIRRILKLK